MKRLSALVLFSVIVTMGCRTTGSSSLYEGGDGTGSSGGCDVAASQELDYRLAIEMRHMEGIASVADLTTAANQFGLDESQPFSKLIASIANASVAGNSEGTEYDVQEAEDLARKLKVGYGIQCSQSGSCGVTNPSQTAGNPNAFSEENLVRGYAEQVKRQAAEESPNNASARAAEILVEDMLDVLNRPMSEHALLVGIDYIEAVDYLETDSNFKNNQHYNSIKVFVDLLRMRASAFELENFELVNGDEMSQEAVNARRRELTDDITGAADRVIVAVAPGQQTQVTDASRTKMINKSLQTFELVAALGARVNAQGQRTSSELGESLRSKVAQNNRVFSQDAKQRAEIVGEAEAIMAEATTSRPSAETATRVKARAGSLAESVGRGNPELGGRLRTIQTAMSFRDGQLRFEPSRTQSPAYNRSVEGTLTEVANNYGRTEVTRAEVLSNIVGGGGSGRVRGR